MHERIRAADPDFADVGFAIFQFSTPPKGARTPIVAFDHSYELFSFDDLEEMVRETYELWGEISEDKAADLRRRKKAAGGGFL
jgi:hypothetical protein